MTALDDLMCKDSVKRRHMEAMTMRESCSYTMTRVHISLQKVAVHLVSLCHVDPASQRLSTSRLELLSFLKVLFSPIRIDFLKNF